MNNQLPAEFFSLSADQLTALNYLLSLLIADGLNANQLNIIGNFLCAVGQNILLLQAFVGALPDQNAVYKAGCGQTLPTCTTTTNPNDSSTDIAIKLASLEQSVNELTDQLACMKNLLTEHIDYEPD